jgi:sugar phosphate isomerase/epimerase
MYHRVYNIGKARFLNACPGLNPQEEPIMRLGGPVFNSDGGPHDWIAALQRRGYRASYCPVIHEDDHETVLAYINAAHEADIIIAEVGAWSNPLSQDEQTRREAVAYCQQQLALADDVGAVCCVNIAGSRGDLWDGPHPDNLTAGTFDLIVETVRTIIDAVKPRRTFYTLEPMPWLYPDSTESYLALIDAVDRPAFAVHFDPVNLVCSPQRYFNNAALIREFVEKLGPQIKSVHAKDIVLDTALTTHLDEVRPGRGQLDYDALLRSLQPLGHDLPIMLEHLEEEEDYRLAASYVRAKAAKQGIEL